MANTTNDEKLSEKVVEHYWTLLGSRRGKFWVARRVHQTAGEPNRVQFDAAGVLVREESRQDVVGFYHTHPAGSQEPSKRDDRTMRGWVGALGKPLLCLIEADGVPTAYLYESDEAKAKRLAACQRFPRNVVLVYGGNDDEP